LKVQPHSLAGAVAVAEVEVAVAAAAAGAAVAVVVGAFLGLPAAVAVVIRALPVAEEAAVTRVRPAVAEEEAVTRVHPAVAEEEAVTRVHPAVAVGAAVTRVLLVEAVEAAPDRLEAAALPGLHNCPRGVEGVPLHRRASGQRAAVIALPWAAAHPNCPPATGPAREVQIVLLNFLPTGQVPEPVPVPVRVLALAPVPGPAPSQDSAPAKGMSGISSA
jgi:hypothetical protein